MRIAGSLWSAPPGRQADLLAAAVAGGLQHLHWDSSDGVFAVAGGFEADRARALLADCSPAASEAHLMHEYPAGEVDRWTDLCDLVVVPLEAAGSREAFARVERRGVRAGWAVSLQTPLTAVPAGDVPVLVMAIVPGQAGAPFDERALQRICELAARDTHELIGVDGGVTPARFTDLRSAGANWLVSGNSLFGSDIAAWLAECRTAFA